MESKFVSEYLSAAFLLECTTRNIHQTSVFHFDTGGRADQQHAVCVLQWHHNFWQTLQVHLCYYYRRHFVILISIFHLKRILDIKHKTKIFCWWKWFLFVIILDFSLLLSELTVALLPLFWNKFLIDWSWRLDDLSDKWEGNTALEWRSIFEAFIMHQKFLLKKEKKLAKIIGIFTWTWGWDFLTTDDVHSRCIYHIHRHFCCFFFLKMHFIACVLTPNIYEW